MQEDQEMFNRNVPLLISYRAHAMEIYEAPRVEVKASNMRTDHWTAERVHLHVDNYQREREKIALAHFPHQDIQSKMPDK